MTDAPSFAVQLTVGIVLLVSLPTCAWLFLKHIDGRPLLPYEPRRPVPWNALAPLMLLAPLLLALWSALLAVEGDAPTTQMATLTGGVTTSAIGAPPAATLVAAAIGASASELSERMADAQSIVGRIWMQSLLTIVMALGCYALVTVAFNAKPHDLGLPTSWRQFRSDVWIGAVAWIASMAPIYCILYCLFILFQPQEGHPLIEELMTNHSLGMMAAAAFAAVVAAPLYEETAFRLIFQGWLERRAMLARPVITQEPIPQTIDSPAAPPAEVAYAYAPPGWAPIVVSSILFGLAHYGHGVAPAPLILLGIVLGYLYQKTHRILPCIVCHALFNSFTFLILALEFASAS